MKDKEILLSKLKPLRPAVISSINLKDKDTLKKLMALGVLPGVSVKVIQQTPSYVFQAGNTKIAADFKIVSSIKVVEKSKKA